MPRLSTHLLPTSTVPGNPGTPEDITGEKYKGDGFYNYSDGLHTIAHFLSGFEGKLEVQGALTTDPVEADWVTIDEREGTPATAGFAEAAMAPAISAGTPPFALGAATYDFDVTIDGGPVQQLSISVVGGEDFTDIAALMDAQVVGGAVTLETSAFRVTSDTTGLTSSATIAVGTAGSAGGDLFAAILAQDPGGTGTNGTTTTFPAPTAGTSGALTENATYNFTGNFVWIRAKVTDFSQGTITKIQLNH